MTTLFSHRQSPEGGLPEWVIIELQGDLETRGEEVLDNQFIGDLNYDKYGQPVIVNLKYNLLSSFINR